MILGGRVGGGSRLMGLGGRISGDRRLSLGGSVGGGRLIGLLVQDHLLQDDVEGSANKQLTQGHTHDQSPTGNGKASCGKGGGLAIFQNRSRIRHHLPKYLRVRVRRPRFTRRVASDSCKKQASRTANKNQNKIFYRWGHSSMISGSDFYNF